MQQENIDEVKDRLYVPSAENPEKIASVEEVHSDFLQEYINFFGLSQPWSKPDTQCLQALREHNILFDPQQYFCTTPLIQLTNHSPNYEFLTVSIQFGLFTFHEIIIANNSFVFPVKLTTYEGWGTFGKVFKIVFQEWELALKVCFLSKSQSVKADLDDLSQKIQSVLKEYCMSKLASALGVGPRICSQMGFDIIVYKDCVGYPMEYCQNDKYDTAFVQSEADLKKKLLRMHSFQFVHLDIKDDNICYNKRKKEFVFIDFGLSTIIPERIGHKSYTIYLGTANYCSPEMAKLITKEDGGYVDLYHNDKCCLEKVLSPEGDVWRDSQQPINLDYLYRKEDVSWNGYDSFQKSIMPSYLKYLAYRLKFGQLQETLHANRGRINNTDMGNVYNFIKGSNFSSKSIVSTSRLLINLDQLLTKADRQSISYLSYEEDEMLYQPVYNIVSGLKSIQSKKKNQKLLKSLRDRQLLLNIDEIRRLDYKIYFRLLLEVIQINVGSCTYEQRLKYCQVARVVFKRVPRKSMTAICERVNFIFRGRQPLPDDLQVVSLILFCYSLQGKIDATKIAIFHSVIYNVVLLRIVDLEALLSFYRKLQCLPLDLCKKMRMILKFRTTLHWKHFEIGSPFDERVKFIQIIKDLDKSFEQQQHALLQQRQRQFIKLVNLECITRNTHQNVSRLKAGLQQVANGRYSQYLKEKEFQQQVKMWYLCNLIRKGLFCQKQAQEALANEVFNYLQKKEKVIQYFHLEFIIHRLRMREGSALQVVELFDNFFKGTKIAEKYCMDLVRQVILFYLCHRSNYRDFLQFALGFDLSKVSFQSTFGVQIKEVFCLIIQDKTITTLPAHLRKVYDSLKVPDWIKDSFTFLEQTAAQKVLNIMSDAVKVQFYLFRAHHSDQVQAILQPMIKIIYEYAYQKIRGFNSKKCMNNALLILNALGVYAIFRKRHFPEAVQLMKYIYRIYESMPGQEDIDLNTKLEVYRFFLQLTYVKDVTAAIKKEDSIPMFQNYIRLVKELSIYKDLLHQQILFIEVMAFLLRTNQSELPALINRLSMEALEAPTTNQLHNYYISMEMLFRCGQFTHLLDRASVHILANMDDIKKNPYNAIYLCFAMYNPKVHSQKRFLQLCTNFNKMKKTISERIRACYYKYFIMHFRSQLTQRKKRRLFLLGFKYDYKQWKEQNIRKIDERTLTIILSGEQMYRWMSRRAIEKFDTVTMKLKEYFLGVNQRGDEFEDEIKQSPEYFFHMQAKALKDRQ